MSRREMIMMMEKRKIVDVAEDIYKETQCNCNSERKRDGKIMNGKGAHQIFHNFHW